MCAYLHQIQADGEEHLHGESNYVTRKWRMLRYFSCSEDSTQPATSTKFHHLSAFWASLQSAAPGLAS